MPTNAVAQTMKEDGFARSSTVHAELFQLKNGRAQWDLWTLVLVDEAATMDAKVTGEVLREARLSGAKVVLAGNDRQLGSIERGGLFTELKKEHGSAELTQVTRQNVDWQKEAARDRRMGASSKPCGPSPETRRWCGRRSRMNCEKTGRAVGQGCCFESVGMAVRVRLHQQGCRCAEQGSARGASRAW
ncbi:AAA family ATPase [Mesorhizobium sp. M0684]|uniref:AAA family ATPase n=1 Tax=Mesorhizobium sp. M0684 TaxID=2956986 RepID=UPI0033392AC0